MRVLLASLTALLLLLVCLSAPAASPQASSTATAPTAPAPAAPAEVAPTPTATEPAATLPVTPAPADGSTSAPSAGAAAPAPKRCFLDPTPGCTVTSKDAAAAKRLYERGMKLRKRHPEQALDAFEQASKLAPSNTEYATMREIVRQELVSAHLRSGNKKVLADSNEAAASEFEKALSLDPDSHFAAERLRDVTVSQEAQIGFIENAPDGGRIVLSPKAILSSFHLVNDSQSVLSVVGSTFGIKMQFDSSVQSRRVKLDVDDVDFYSALRTACLATHTFWMPLSATEIMLADDSPSVHKELDHWVLRIFRFPDVMTAAELNDMFNMLRTLFEIRFLAPQPANKTITVRAPAVVVDAAARLLASMSSGRPQVLIDFEVFEIDRQMMQAIGVDMPLQFTVFQISSSVLAALGSQNAQAVINQLIASGGITQANSTAVAGLLAQLQNQQSSLFQYPVATFGGGQTLMGVGIPPATVNFSSNHSYLKLLDRVTLRVAQGDQGTFRLGQRYPVLNSIYSAAYSAVPVFNSPTASSVATAFPSFNYEDLGLTLKAKPLIQNPQSVRLDLEMDMRTLGSDSYNGIPAINQRSYKGSITVKNDEPAVVAGYLSSSDLKTLTGPPGLSLIPGLNTITSNKTNQHTTSELLVVITPHVMSSGFEGATPAVAIPPAAP